MVQGLLGQINAANQGPSAMPLNEVRPGPEPHFQHAFAAVTAELGEGMNERLITITKGFDFVEISFGKLGRFRDLSITTLPVPKLFDLRLEIFRTKALHGVRWLLSFKSAASAAPRL